MVAVRGVVERAGLVDDAHAGFLGLDDDLLDVVDAVLDGVMQGHAGFDRGLRVEFRRVGNLEQHVLHDVAAVVALEAELIAFEEHVVEAPGLR